MHVTLDGLAARPNGSLDCFKVDEKLFDFAHKRTQESDIAIYARKTYEIMDAYWPNAASKPNATKHDIDHSTWYNQVKKYVVSNSWKGRTLSNATLISDNAIDTIAQLKQGEGKDIILFGSPSLGDQLTEAELIDEYWFFLNPVLIGEGLPLFRHIKHQVNLQLESSTPFDNGIIGLQYKK